MTTWQELKPKLTTIKPAEMTAIDRLAYLHAQRIKQGISQKKQLAEYDNLDGTQLVFVDKEYPDPK